MHDTDRRPYDSATVTVLMEHNIVFQFDVQDWDTENDPGKKTTDEEAYAMARGLVMNDRVELYGKLNGVECLTVIDPERVVALYATPTGLED